MKATLLAVALFIVSSVSTVSSFAGPCDHSWETAKDGSSCGGRAADEKEGGN